ncbi:deoxyguanosinetriphosphate triphosphohydrolase [Kocuria coralli]|uniref:Deoxyguanosinetriphosphate triphosphohydrolase-like protein n=1 Tax=Kocuria coralli TaxID=1461025 RepID=A0A5J5KWS3_9MICC|nr:deoxyguanosinetriphosphate triphosphohydrolase [Kocuria coralli]KAA9393858.1 deoxyguanosinetriphosphate triphosphohydrolase [Kocuria coralli]
MLAEVDRTRTPAEGYAARDIERWVTENHHNKYRSHFERDRARILHSSALRRLAAKTQVVAPSSDDFVRNRLTHSLEVAQIGREVGRLLGCDPDVVDAACLSHDLGHPPFGHNGEQELNEQAAEIGGFEGNAQTLRLLVRLEPKVIAGDGEAEESAGLNLTRATLDATCKYPWQVHEAPIRPDGSRSHKFGVYQDDLPVFEWMREGAPERTKCLEAQVMDLADDISYSVHDVEDAVAAGMLRLNRLSDPRQRERVFENTRDWYLPGVEDSVLDAALSRLESAPEWVREMSGSRRDLARLKDMTSQLIGRFAMSAVAATRTVTGQGALTRYAASMVVPGETVDEIAVLKGIAVTYMMNVRDAMPIHENQREILRLLTESLMDSDGRFLAPAFATDWHHVGDGPGAEGRRLRIVIDQIASLTDTSALRLHDRIMGATWRVGDKPLW